MTSGNFKVRCVDLCGVNHADYTVGKVYEVKNGILTSDDGTHFTADNFEQWQRFSSSKFELVEESQQSEKEIKQMKHEFKVGDRVRIRQWDDMEKEYGLTSLGNISCKSVFMADMKDLCGNTATITHIEPDGQIKLNHWSDCIDVVRAFTTDMIEPAELMKKPLILIYPNSKNRKETIAVIKDGNTVVNTEKAIYNPIYEKEGFYYSFAEGARIALEKLLGIKVDKIKDKPVTEVPIYKEVEREAKVGEYVKIVKADATNGCYKNGDVFCVIKVENGGVYFETEKTHPSCEKGHSYAWNEEYVVLEDYQPPKNDNNTFDWDKFKEGKFAVHCDTEEKADAFLKECDEHGIKWGIGGRASNSNYYSINQKNTAYCMPHGTLEFARYRFYKDEWKKTIVDYQLNVTKNPEPQKFVKAKVGDRIRIVKDKALHSPRVKMGDEFVITEVSCSDVSTDTHMFDDIDEEYIIIDSTTSQSKSKPNISAFSNEELIAELSKRINK